MVESTNELKALAEFPGLPILYSIDDGVTWSEYKPGVKLIKEDVERTSEVQLVTT